MLYMFSQSKAKYTDMEIQVNEINKLVKITGKSADVQIVKVCQFAVIVINVKKKFPYYKADSLSLFYIPSYVYCTSWFK